VGLHLVLLIIAAVLFLLAGIGVDHPKVRFGWLGLLAFVLAFIVK
jgi:hypothetical protein